MAIKLPKTFIDYSLLVGLSLVLATNFTMTKVAVATLPPFLVVAVRLAIAALLLIVIMRLAKQWFPKWGPIWWPLALSAFFGHTLPFSLLSWTQQKLDAGLTAILMATMPLFTLLLAQLFTKDERPNRYSIAGFAIALAGIIILFGPDKLMSLADQSLRQYAAVLAAICYGINAIVTKSLTALPWQQSTAAFMTLAFLMSLPTLLFTEVSFSVTNAGAWWAVVYSGVMSTAFAAVMIIVIIRRSSASFLSQINFMIPVFGVIISMLLLGEILPPNGAIALFIILCGVALARRRPTRNLISINKGV